MSADASGRSYAKLSELREGDMVELDGGFTCASGTKFINMSEGRLFFNCDHGCHFLDGQVDAVGYCTGVYKL